MKEIIKQIEAQPGGPSHFIAITNDCYDPMQRARETSTFRITPTSFMAMVRVV